MIVEKKDGKLKEAGNDLPKKYKYLLQLEACDGVNHHSKPNHEWI